MLSIILVVYTVKTKPDVSRMGFVHENPMVVNTIRLSKGAKIVPSGCPIMKNVDAFAFGVVVAVGLRSLMMAPNFNSFRPQQ